MPKFKVGDRVRVHRVDCGDAFSVGQIATILEDSHVPFVEFDTRTQHELQPHAIQDLSREFKRPLKNGHVLAVDEDQVELYVEAKPAVSDNPLFHMEKRHGDR